MRRRLALGLPAVAAALALMGCQPSSTQTSLHPTAPLPTSAAASQQPAAVHVGAAPAPRNSTPPSLVRSLSGQPLPDPHLTPGESFQGVGPSSFCVSGYTARVRNVSTSLKRAVFAEYHLSYAAHAGYEVDHLIPLELGGDNSISNLWPEK